jgi:hypothetical protein
MLQQKAAFHATAQRSNETANGVSHKEHKVFDTQRPQNNSRRLLRDTVAGCSFVPLVRA